MNGSYFIRVASHVLLLQPQLGVLQLTTAVHRQPQQVGKLTAVQFCNGNFSGTRSKYLMV